MYSGYGIAFDSAASLSFNNVTVRNFIIFDVDNSSPYHSDNGKKTFLILCEGPTYGIHENFGSREKKLIISFTKANTKLCFEFPL